MILRSSIRRLYQIRTQSDLHLGMEVPGWPPENIEGLAEAYAARVDA